MSIPLRAGDPHDDRLRAMVRPSDWVNPEPASVYNLVAIGAGTAGLVAAGGAGGLGAKTALIERDLPGGDCLNVGCVPSKSLLRAAQAAANIRRAAEFGVHPNGDVRVDFAAVMDRVRAVRADLSRNDSPARFRDEYGVDVFFGEAKFTGRDTLEVGGKTLRFRTAVIATGTRATVPDIPGLSDVEYLTNETVFSLTELPSRLLVIGGGPIGCELGQAFARLGSRVTLVASSSQLLPHDDSDAAAMLADGLRADGVDARLSAKVERIEPGSPNVAIVGGGRIEFDAVLVAAGRTANVESLNLDAAGVVVADGRPLTDDYLQTTNPNVYSAGDVAGKQQFTHAADVMARTVVRNALFPSRSAYPVSTIPWCTYTTPEVARIGLSREEAATRSTDLDRYEYSYSDLDRAVTAGDTGFIRVLTHKGSDTIVGATVVGTNAGEIIGLISLAMTNKLGLKAIAGTVFPYPTYLEVVKKVADKYNRTRLTGIVKTGVRAWLRWKR